MTESSRLASNLGVKTMLLGVEATLLGRFVFESMAVALLGAALCLLGIFL